MQCRKTILELLEPVLGPTTAKSSHRFKLRAESDTSRPRLFFQLHTNVGDGKRRYSTTQDQQNTPKTRQSCPVTKKFPTNSMLKYHHGTQSQAQPASANNSLTKWRRKRPSHGLETHGAAKSIEQALSHKFPSAESTCTSSKLRHTQRGQ